MAPDLNTFPPSPRSNRHSSGAPPISRSTSQTTSSTMATMMQSLHHQDESFPVRYPKPMTAAQIHLELEQEQEAVVNRLTRELSALRAQTASVVSNASSTSSSASVFDHPTNEAQTPSSNYPTSARRHRSSSSLSTRSINASSSTVPGTSQASIDRARDATGVSGGRSRQNSLVPPTLSSVSMPAQSRSRAPSVSPSPMPHQHASTYFPPTQQLFASGPLPSPSRYEDAAAMRAALEFARKENEMLAARVRELEGLLKIQQRQASERPAIAVTDGERDEDSVVEKEQDMSSQE